jgi:hypothetical protein
MNAKSVANLSALARQWLAPGDASLKKKAKSKIGRPMASSAPVSGVRSFFTDTRGRRWRWVVDDRMRDYGDIDYNRRIIRINRAMHRLDGESLLDTLFHEELHRLFPNLGERAICCMTKLLLPTLSRKYRAWLYARIRRR